MLATQGLLAIASLTGEPPRRDTVARAMAVHDAITFYDEHTFGSSLSVEDPTVESTMVQWGQKGSYAWEAVKQAGMLREEAIGALNNVMPFIKGLANGEQGGNCWPVFSLAYILNTNPNCFKLF
jgi:hypothetical protein